jgi:hypothetical protein
MVQTDYNSHNLFKSCCLAKFVNPNELANKVLTDQQRVYVYVFRELKLFA